MAKLMRDILSETDSNPATPGELVRSARKRFDLTQAGKFERIGKWTGPDDSPLRRAIRRSVRSASGVAPVPERSAGAHRQAPGNREAGAGTAEEKTGGLTRLA
jgi:hypothetical protein